MPGPPTEDSAPSEKTDEDLSEQEALMAALSEMFRDEAFAQLDGVETVLLAVEEGDENPELLHEAFRAMHSLKGNCGCIGLFELEELAHRVEDYLDEIRNGQRKLSSDLASAILAIVDAVRNAITNLDSSGGEVVGKDGLISALHVAAKAGGTIDPAAEGQETQEPPPTDTAPSVSVGPAPAESQPAKTTSRFVRVEVDKLDSLINEVGELISATAAVAQSPDLEGLELDRFHIAAGHLGRVMSHVHDSAMAMRMVPVKGQFRKMVRIVRDLRQRLGKHVELEIRGEETEVDKSVIEALSDPLVHCIRNAIDHGIESPEVRAEAGKDPVGNVRLTARHQGGEVWIVIEDDGKGIDPEAIRNSAIRKGLVSPEQKLSDLESLQLIFLPGFSTAAKVTNVSGRGVGMDVVKREIEAIRGRVEVQSELGKGSTFAIRLPLTLAIIDAMLVRIDGSIYAIPLLNVRESVSADQGKITVLPDGSTMMRLRDRVYAVARLRDIYGYDHQQPEKSAGIFVLVEDDSQVFCLSVDEVIDQRQIVIKALDGLLGSMRGISGCSLLGTGDICLIIDVAATGRLAMRLTGDERRAGGSSVPSSEPDPARDDSTLSIAS